MLRQFAKKSGMQFSFHPYLSSMIPSVFIR